MKLYILNIRGYIGGIRMEDFVVAEDECNDTRIILEDADEEG